MAQKLDTRRPGNGVTTTHSVNIAPAERTGRVVLGAAAIVAAVALLTVTEEGTMNFSQRDLQSSRPRDAHGRPGHGWMMIACCIPMLVIALALVATGVVGPGFLFAAIACTAMMAMMMRGMSAGDGDR